MKFAHLADCHLGSWKIPELQQLNLESFKKAVEICIQERVAFVLIAGDLFDSAYPPIEILKETFVEFRRLKEAGIPCYLIAGSHDFSVSGKTFLDVLEKAGFCINIAKSQEKDEKLYLEPTMLRDFALYGFSGKKAGIEVSDIKKMQLIDSPGFFKVLTLHTTITEAKKNLPIDSVSYEELPKADYYALGHLHDGYEKANLVYPGPIFPNNFQELDELKYGSFYICENTGKFLKCRKVLLKIKEPLRMEVEITNALTATDTILEELKKHELKDKILLLRIFGKLKQGKTSDIKFQEIEKFAKEKGVFTILRNISSIETEEQTIEIKSGDMETIETDILKVYAEKNPNKFNKVIEKLLSSLNLEKFEDEKVQAYESRIFEDVKKILEV